MAVKFLTLKHVLRIHQDQIARYGGSPGVRDQGLLESALAMPSASFAGAYLHEDLPTMAAAYLFHLVQNHPFFDGNKRVGAVSARVFALINGLPFNPPESEFEELVLRVAQGELDKTVIADFFRRHSQSAS